MLGFAACNEPWLSTTPTPGAGFPADQIARGEYLVSSLADCGSCHTSDPTKPFGGGVKFAIDGAGHYVYSRNITPDPSTGLKLSEDDFITMMRTGKDFSNDGQSLIVMPWPNFRWMSDYDLKSLYAFLQVIPAASNAVPPDNKGPLASQGPVPFPAQYNEGEETRDLPPTNSPNPLGAADATADPDPENAVRGAAILPLAYAKMPNYFNRTPEEQASFARGSYLVNIAACSDCHTNNGGSPRNLTPGPNYLQIATQDYLIGGATFTVPGALNTTLGETRSMSQNLIGQTNGFFNRPMMTYAFFAEEITTMQHTGDNPPLPLGWPMPASLYRNLQPQDLQDIYTYMLILAQDYNHTGQADKATQDPARYCTTASDCVPGDTCFVDSSAGMTVNNQCLAASCMADSDCDACQKCSAAGACQAPSASDACLTSGI
jgi:mono/diheme cytochrome c family protein